MEEELEEVEEELGEEEEELEEEEEELVVQRGAINQQIFESTIWDKFHICC